MIANRWSIRTTVVAAIQAPDARKVPPPRLPRPPPHVRAFICYNVDRLDYNRSYLGYQDRAVDLKRAQAAFAVVLDPARHSALLSDLPALS